MKKLIFTLLVFGNVALADPRIVDADHDDLVHSAAHFGMSYAIQDISQRLLAKAFGMPRSTAFFFGLIISNSIGLTYKYTEGSGPVQGLGRAILWNNLGNFTAGATFCLLKF